jgi:hypothetical protein
MIETCPMFNEKCNYCSMEMTTRSYTKIKLNSDLKLYEPIGIGRKKVELGYWCNNHPIGKTGWVDEMHTCPALWGLHRGTKPLKLVQIPEPKKRGRPVIVHKIVKVKKKRGRPAKMQKKRGRPLKVK